MSRLLSSFVFFLFIASNYCFGQLNVNFSTATPNPGETVEINVSVSNFVDIELFQFGIGWDSTVASFVAISNVTDQLAQFSEANNIGTPNNAALIDDGELSLSWSLNSTEPVTLTDGTVLFTIVLDVEGIACDETEFMVTSPPIGGNIEVFTNNLSVNIGATSSGGLVSIPGTDCGGGGGMDGVGLIGSMQSGISGTQTCVSVTTENFTNIASLQTGLTWNPAIISYASVQEGALNGISLNENETANGELKLLWLIGLGDDPVTLNDGANLFDICFDIVGNEGQMSDVSFVDLPNFNVEIADGDGISLDYFVEDGKVTVGTGGGGGGETCDVGVGLIGDSLSTAGVTNICVPFTSKDFTDIASVQTGIVWDESVIGLTEVVDGAMTDISVNDLNADMGELKLLWLIGLGDDPVTVSDGTVLFELCFDVLGAEGSSSSISFVDLPNFNIEIANGDGMSEDYCTITGFVEVAEDGGGGGEICDVGVGIIGDSLSTNGVSNICVPVTSRSFTNVASVQTGITWDDAVLDLTEVIEGALTDISVNTLNASMGELKLLWIIGLSDDPVTVPDETVLFELCFDVFGSEGSTSDISFVDLPGFDIEVASGEGMAAEFCTITGFVEVTEEGGGGGETCDLGVGLIGDSLNTNGLTNVCISVTSKDFTSIASVQTGVTWDESILDLTGVNDGAMSGISVNALNAAMGELKLLWIIGLGDDPVTVPDGTVLFELCFDVLGAEGTSSSISFVDLPNFAIEIANGDGMSEEYCTITGFVEVTEDGGGGGETCDIGVGLIGDSLSTNGLTNICIPVTSKDFTSIASVQTGVTWDESILDLTGVNDGAMSGISVNALNAAMGELKLLWIIGLGDDPVTVPDGTVLFELCFDVLGAEGTSSSISFVDLPNFEIEIANGDGMSEEYCTITGFVEVTEDGGGGGETCDLGVGLIGDSLNTNGLTNVCISVTSKDFTNIASVQTGVTWDESILDLTGVNDGAMSGISVNALNAAMGELKLLWIIGLGDDPVTVPDGTVLFEMCFDVLGAEGTSSSISFVDLPNFEIEIANGDGMSEEYCTITGFVEVTEDGGGGGETCDIGVGLIGDSLNTNGLTNICVPVTSKDFTSIASVQTGVTWDESILDLNGVNDGAMSGISVNALNAAMGELKLLWIIGLGDDPVTVPDGTVLFEMCFDVLGAEGTSSSISFVDLPNFEIEIANGDGMSEEYCTITGFVEVTEDGGGGGETCDIGVGLIGDSLSTNGLTNICVPVTSKDFTSIASVQTGVTWDESILDLNGVNDGAMSGISVNALNAAMGELKLLWIIGLGDDPVTVPDGTVLFELCFDVLGAEGTSSSISFVDLPDFEIEIANGEGMSEEFCTITGFVEVTEDGGGGETCDVGVGLIGDSLSTNGVTNICVPVTSKNFTSIASVQTGVTWDESILDLTSVNDGAMSGISENAINADIGELKLLWIIGLGDDPVTVPDGTVLFELCFDVLGAEGTSSSISFVDLPDFEIEIANGEGMSEDYCTITGFVNVTPEGQENCEVGVGIIGDTLSVDISVDVSFCMPITTKNFSNIASLQTGIQWDPTVLSYTSVNEVNLTNASLNTTNAANGDIRFLWIIGLGDNPVTLDDGATLFEICFDAVGEGEDMSDVSFIDLENFDVEIANGNGQAVDVCLIPGKVTLIDPVIPSDFSLIANDVSADQGSQTCVDVDVTGFTDIQSTQFTIQWDDAVLTFDRVEMLNPSICDITANNFFPVGDDKLRVSWSCANSSTIPDSSLFFKICFDVIGECNPASSSTVEFVDDPPVNIEITNTDNEEIDPVILVSGSVSVNECPEEFVCILTAVDSVKCKGDASGGIFVEFAGAVGEVNCSWTGPGGPYTDCDLQGIFAGTYILTATDEAGSSCTMEVEVIEPDQALSINTEVTTAVCGEGGKIDVTVMGGTGDYTYTWDPDQGNVEDLTGLVPGEYCVVVSDENGCTIDKCMTVGDSSIDLNITGESISNVACEGSGAIDLNVEGGCTPLTFTWTFNGGIVGSNEDLTGLTETGTYTISITDSSDPAQEIIMDYFVGSDIETLTISQATTTNISCSSLGAVDISASGGCGPLSYTWTFNDRNIGTDQDISELKDAGRYSVVIRDVNTPAQEVTMDFVLTSSVTELVVTGRASNLSCNGDRDGSVELIVSGGCPNYVFEWDNGETTEDIFNLAAGTYCVSVNDQFCPEEDPIVMCFDVEEPSPVMIDLIGIQHVTNLDGNNGVIDIEPNGGSGAYSFEWTPNGSVTEDQINMPPGEYCVTVTDDNNCSAEACYTIMWAAVFLDNCVATPSECSGECTGTINCDIVGGCSDVEIRINNVLVEAFPILDLCADTYTIEIVDECGNTDTEVIIIPEPGDMVLDTVEVICTDADQRTGSIEIDIEGGTEPYVITWGGASECDGSTTCTGLGVGFYTVVVEDGGGCQALIQNIEITECTGPPKDCFEARPIITPNDDGLNDQFIITCADGFNNANLQVYDRWGRLVYEQDDYDSTWEGTHSNGTELNDGGYMWVLEIQLPNGDTILRNGSLTIIRTNF